ncbi:Thioredoxin reductase [Aequoribacter fuscus]|uniref:Thioredoxin reductase n=1 Tax=Aequoribacter fuscus TaxID=2518989 RepID=F3L561_9GAMM|nr:NAD(P)-binding domain-containing protein [Aequoribacter fuscus]EGG28534.1 Thioredoxin reductase [Aequoribacter fuscus]
MFTLEPLLLLYILPFAVFLLIYQWVRAWSEKAAKRRLDDAVQSHMTEPPTLHPIIDPSKCLGCGACVNACPEGDVLGLIGGKSVLINGANCIGHGACKAACPFDAIDLVFGTAKRGVSIPVLSPDFESTLSGVFVAGELGGMGLIRNAIMQGSQAVISAASFLKQVPKTEDRDLLIIGAGPAGIAAALQAKALGLAATVIEQSEDLGGTVANFPKNKLVMTAPVELPLVGKLKFRETSKEALLDFWTGVINEHKPDIRFGIQMVSVEGTAPHFRVQTTEAEFCARSVILALGRRGTPRKLDVPGEHLSKVVYRLADPEQYADQRVLVVGGGDSAIEAACEIAEAQATPNVALSYRGEGFARAKLKNRKRVDALEASGRLRVMLGSNVIKISDDSVTLQTENVEEEVANDAVLICAGGVLPNALLEKIGVSMDVKYGTP